MSLGDIFPDAFGTDQPAEGQGADGSTSIMHEFPICAPLRLVQTVQDNEIARISNMIAILSRMIRGGL
jgi:hypothetical protein